MKGAPWVVTRAIGQGLHVVQCRVCGQGGTGTPAVIAQFARAHAQHQSEQPGFYGLGDMVARATKAVGIAPCTPCEARRLALNGLVPKVWRR